MNKYFVFIIRYCIIEKYTIRLKGLTPKEPRGRQIKLAPFIIVVKEPFEAMTIDDCSYLVSLNNGLIM